MGLRKNGTKNIMDYMVHLGSYVQACVSSLSRSGNIS